MGRGLRIIENLLQGTGQEIGAEASKLIEKSEKKSWLALTVFTVKGELPP